MNKPATKKTSIGGQALIEGVMMRGPETTAMAVRHVDGHIVLETFPTTGRERSELWKLPFFRGIYNMVDSMRFGYKCLMRSAALAGLEDEEGNPVKDPAVSAEETAPETAREAACAEVPPAGEGTPDGNGAKVPGGAAEDFSCPAEGEDRPLSSATAAAAPSGAKTAPAEKKGVFQKYGMTILMTLSALLGVGLAVVLFMFLPVFLYNVIAGAIEEYANIYLLEKVFLRSFCEGLLRIVIFIGYLIAVSQMKDIKRVFMYHGAEHKTIFCYEAGEELTVENVRRQSRFHPRCGTSFLVLMLIIGIFVSMCIPITTPVLRTVVKLLTLPIVVGIGYELIKLAGRTNNLFTRILSAPGLWVQRLTTKEPDDGMMACAIAALKPVIPDDPDADRW